jgi:hypothetical protein
LQGNTFKKFIGSDLSAKRGKSDKQD